jgi:hypothetical protein
MARRMGWTLLPGPIGTIVAIPSPFNGTCEDSFEFILEAA